MATGLTATSPASNEAAAMVAGLSLANPLGGPGGLGNPPRGLDGTGL